MNWQMAGSNPAMAHDRHCDMASHIVRVLAGSRAPGFSSILQRVNIHAASATVILA